MTKVKTWNDPSIFTAQRIKEELDRFNVAVRRMKRGTFEQCSEAVPLRLISAGATRAVGRATERGGGEGEREEGVRECV